MANEPCRHVCFVLFQFTNLTLAVLLFTSGFLLKRLEIDKHNSCDLLNLRYPVELDGLNKYDCWLPPLFDRAIFIVIDALRYDFVAFNNSTNDKGKDVLPYQNKLKSVIKILENKPEHSLLYKFIADPPTTTLQRLKGLTTGSLPTFVDAGSNFAGSEVLEDNIINQMYRKQMNITFMGDDTWLSLFPTQFSKQFPYPSLNVKDLETVDNGVISHIFTELKNDDWKFLIGHFLGVDHCGHTFGPVHPRMAEKLQQMDDVLKKLMENMSEDTVLFVLGDHGMTKTGDHGGDSKDELEAALFVYSPKKITHVDGNFRKSTIPHDAGVAQIDLVPTISLMLGIPVPYSNLGMVIPDLFNHCETCKIDTDRMRYQARVLNLNVNQVRTYLHTYSKVSDEFPFSKMEKLESMFKSTNEKYMNIQKSKSVNQLDSAKVKENLANIIEEYKLFLQNARKMCEEIWAKFDLFAMTFGVIYFISSFIFIINMKDPAQLNKLTILAMILNILVAPALLALIFSNVTVTSNTLYYCSVMIFFPIGAYFLFITTSSQTEKESLHKWFYLNYSDKFMWMFILPFIFYVLGYFSNSFVVYEDSVTCYMVQSIICILFYQINFNLKTNIPLKSVSGFKQTNIKKLSKLKTAKFDIGRALTSPRTLALVLSLCFCLLLRLVSYFRACREEQWTCEVSPFMQPLSAITDDLGSYKNLRYFFSVIVLAVIPFVTIKWLKYHGNLNGHTSISIIMQLLPLASVCVGFHWAMQAMPVKMANNIPKWQQLVFAKATYVLVVFSAVVICFKPLSIYLLKREKDQNIPFTSNQDANLVPKMYNHIKMNWQQYLQQSKPKNNEVLQSGDMDDKKTPVVYGLGTVYSSAIIALISVVMLVLMMVLGDGVAPGLVMQYLAMGIFLELHACSAAMDKKRHFGSHAVPWYITVSWCLLCTHFFYGTGHQATIPSIRFESAYVGFDGDFEVYIIPALLILLNTFAAHAIGVLALPLLLFWPMFRGKLIFMFEPDKGPEIDLKGELILHENGSSFRRSLFHLISTYLLVSATKLFFTMVAAGIHRRHLMVWKIFAPRFLFEGATFLFVSVMLMLVYLFVLRIDSALSKWVKKLE